MEFRKHMRGCLLAAGIISALVSPATAADLIPWRGKVTAFAAENFKHPAWGFSHSQRDYALARSLAATDHVTLDDDVLFAAAYLHDMAAFSQWAEDKKDHGDVAAVKIDLVLAGTDFPMAKIDADALDWLGAIGIARLIALVDNKGGKPLGPDMIKGLENDLAAVPSRVLSPAGKAEIAPRIAEERAFLDALRRESDNLSTL